MAFCSKEKQTDKTHACMHDCHEPIIWIFLISAVKEVVNKRLRCFETFSWIDIRWYVFLFYPLIERTLCFEVFFVNLVASDVIVRRTKELTGAVSLDHLEDLSKSKRIRLLKVLCENLYLRYVRKILHYYCVSSCIKFEKQYSENPSFENLWELFIFMSN